MNPRITLVGNSHVAALRRGWDHIKDGFDVDLQFFAANSTLYGQLELSKDKQFGMHDLKKYHPRHVSFLKDHFGDVTVDLSSSDAVVLVGTGIRAKDFVRNLSRFSIDGIRDIEGLPPMSREAFDSFAPSIYQKGPLPEYWMNWSGPRVYILVPPIPSVHCPIEDKRYKVWAQFGQTAQNNIGFLQHYHDIVRAELATQNVHLISQPWDILSENGLTRAQYHDGAKRLDETLEDYADDYHHMNPTYGAKVLRHVLQTVQTDCVPA